MLWSTKELMVFPTAMDEYLSNFWWNQPTLAVPDFADLSNYNPDYLEREDNKNKDGVFVADIFDWQAWMIRCETLRNMWD